MKGKLTFKSFSTVFVYSFFLEKKFFLIWLFQFIM